MQYAVKEVMLNREIEPLTNVKFNDISTVPQIYSFAKNVITPSIYRKVGSVAGDQSLLLL